MDTLRTSYIDVIELVGRQAPGLMPYVIRAGLASPDDNHEVRILAVELDVQRVNSVTEIGAAVLMAISRIELLEKKEHTDAHIKEKIRNRHRGFLRLLASRIRTAQSKAATARSKRLHKRLDALMGAP